MRLAGAYRRLSSLSHIVDFEWPGGAARRRLELLHDTIESALERTRLPHQVAELEYAHQDCHLAMDELRYGPLPDDEMTASHRFRRLARVAVHYESRLERLNRRYWWLLSTLVLAVLFLTCHCCPVADWTYLEASHPICP